MTDIRIPKFNSNDDAYILVDWLAEDGQRVDEGEPVALIETSKAVVELDSPAPGVVRRCLALRGTCAVGDLIAELYATESEYERARDASADHGSGPPRPAAPAGRPTLTRGAGELADRHGLGEEELTALGKKVVRRADIEALLARRTPAPDPSAAATDGGRVAELSPAQRAVGATVSESHRTIPSAYVVVKTTVDRALEHAAELCSSRGVLVGLPELLVMAVASLRERFPYCFATVADERTVVLHDSADVGVTIDTGNGLYIAAVHRAEARSCEDIAQLLMEFRLRSMRQNFRGEDLAGSNIVVSLHNDSDVVLARPIVFPGHTCAVVLAGVLDEVVLDANGVPATRKVVHIGLSYDHRAINGREATDFLRAVKDALEAPEKLTSAQGAQEQDEEPVR